MPYEHAVARDKGIPAFGLTVFKDKIFVGEICAYHVCGVAGDMPQREVVGLHKLHWLEPAEEHTLVGRHAGRCMGAVVVHPVIHEIPFSGGEGGALVHCVVHVGQPQAMAELMHESADAGHPPGVEIDFVGAGIVAEHLAVEPYSPLVVCEVVGMGPDTVGHTAVGGSVAGIYHVDVVDHAVAVEVVLRVVYLVVERAACLYDHIGGMEVLPGEGVVLAVIMIAVLQGHRPIDIEGGVEFPHGIVGIIAAAAPRGSTGGV